MKNLSIRIKILFIVAIAIFVTSLIFVLQSIHTIEAISQDNIEKFKEFSYKSEKEKLVYYSKMAYNIINSYYQKTSKDKIQKEAEKQHQRDTNYLFTIIEGIYTKYKDILDEDSLKQLIIDTVTSTRYDKNGYFWINNMKSIMVAHSINSNLNGKNLSKLKDINGKSFFAEFIKVCQKDGAGFVDYLWSKPGFDTPQPKISYVRLFKPFNWVIGTGVYVSDITASMKQQALQAIKNLRYGKNGYFWINDMDNKMIMHPIKPQYDGKIFINAPKVPFVELGTKKLKETNKLQVFIEYQFYTPATKKYSHKLSVVYRFKPWDWVIGTGAYTDYIEAKLQQEAKKAQNDMQQKVRNLLIISFIAMLIFVFAMIVMLNKMIIFPLEKFQKGLNDFFNYLADESVVVQKLPAKSNDEIGLMSKRTNEAIENAVHIHKELLDLRRQLEIKVQNTTQDLQQTKEAFRLIAKDQDEALKSGALIQASILPNKKTLEDVFSEHFILDVQHNAIHSQVYMLEKVKDNQYLFILVDTKDEGLQSVFDTMLIHAIIKQAITQLRYDRHAVVSTSWLMEYLNTNIDTTQKGIDIAILYYNKEDLKITYSSANLPLHCYQDEALSIIQPDKTSIGISKDTKYQEHIIDTKEYIELYIATHKYIKDNIDIYDFQSPFLTNNNNFKANLENIDDNVVVAGLQIDNKPKILIEHQGEFTLQLVNQYIEQIEDSIENMGLMSNVSTTFVEQFQNILNYGKSDDMSITEITPYGYIKLQRNPDKTYAIETINTITLADKQKIEPKLYEIKSLDRNGIRKRYRELRKSGQNTHAKGGGIGFYEIAKRCIKIEYEFTQINEDRFKFKFVSYLGKNK